MSQLYFKFGQMNCGKTTTLIQNAYNYQERGMRVIVLKPAVDTRETIAPEVVSRIGLVHEARIVSQNTNLFQLAVHSNDAGRLHCVMVDEAQFLTPEQVDQLSDVVDMLDIPVLCYGLRSDFQGNAFPGSLRLLTIADKLEEIKTVCHCGKKATMVLRLDANGDVVRSGEQIQIGGNESYVSVCRKHFISGKVN